MNLSQFIEWLASNPWLIITGFIITLISLLLAIIFYIKSKKVKLLCYAIRSQNIVRDLVSRIDLLEMLYDGKRIENLTATKIAFWNAGNDIIDKNDIVNNCPLTVNVEKGYKILDVKTFNNDKGNQFSIKLSDDRSHIDISFEYLAKNEGEIIQLLHTGKSEQDIKIDGRMKYSSKPPMLTNATNTINSPLKIILGVCFGLPIYLIVEIVSNGIIRPTIYDIMGMAFLFILFWGSGFAILSRHFLPNGFKKFEEEY